MVAKRVDIKLLNVMQPFRSWFKVELLETLWNSQGQKAEEELCQKWGQEPLCYHYSVT